MDLLKTMINDICGPDLINSVFDSLSMDLFQGTAALEAVKALHEAIKPVALMIMFIYFMVALVDILSSENFTWEQLWRKLALLLAAKLLIDYGFDIIENLFDLGRAVFGDLYGQYEEFHAPAVEVDKMIKTWQEGWGGWMPEFFMKIIFFMILFFPWLLSWLMQIVVAVICYSRIIEIYARATFAPIAISDFFHSGIQGTGWRFLKSFLAVSLQGAMILVIAIIYAKLFEEMSFAETNIFKFVGKYLAFYASAVMLMLKSLPLTKEIIGVN